jgi:acetyl-CoA acyltransferase
MAFPMNGNGRRVAVVAGARTPFARAWTVFKEMGSADLGAEAVRGLLHRTELDPAEVDYAVFGCAAAPINGPHVAREVIFRTQVPASVPATTVQFYCASSARAVIDGANEIALGHADVVIAGGVESLSENQVLFSKNFTHALQAASKGRSVGQKLGALKSLSFGDLAPEAPGINEPTTGMSMGQHAELMAKEMGIPREEQDAWAVESHRRAHRAFESGRLADQICTVQVPPDYDRPLDRDTDVRADTSVEALSRLRPVFDRQWGTVTAGNASPLTDGGSAVLLMSEEKAKALGYEPLCYLRSYGMAGIDIQKEHLLLGPTYSAPIALERAGMKLSDIDFVEMHEAFAAQVLATLRRFESKEHADMLGLSAPIGEIDLEKLNPNGGSIAMGHPFGATGARVISQAAHELVAGDHETCFVSICAGGGLGFSMVLERAA